MKNLWLSLLEIFLEPNISMGYREILLNLSSKPNNYFYQSRQEMLAFIPPAAQKILEVGCGGGTFGGLIKKSRNAEIWGVELDPEAAKDAAVVLDKVLVGDIIKLAPDLPDNYFDAIVFNDLLEHLPDPFSLLEKIKSKLAPGGAIVCSLPNVRYLINLKKLLWDKQWLYEDEGVLDKTHLRFFTAKSIARMFAALGYEVIKLEGINPINSYKFKIINLLTLGFLRDTCYIQFACVARAK
jgi:SAM-dependent methyltransferase